MVSQLSRGLRLSSLGGRAAAPPGTFPSTRARSPAWKRYPFRWRRGSVDRQLGGLPDRGGERDGRPLRVLRIGRPSLLYSSRRRRGSAAADVSNVPTRGPSGRPRFSLPLSTPFDVPALLLDLSGPDAVVEAPTSLVDDQHLDGLDATETWSPLLRPGVLMDIDSYAAWERCGIGLLLHGRAMPGRRWVRLDRATAIVTGWTPDSDRPLLHWTTAAFDDTMNLPTIGSLSDGAQFAAVCGAVWLAMSRPASVEDLSQKLTAVVDALQHHSASGQTDGSRRASSARGSLIRRSGLLTIARYLHAALDVLTVEIARVPGRIDRGAVLESIRRTDYLLVHLADSQQIARLALLTSYDCP